MPFLKRLFGLDAASLRSRGDGFFDSGSYGLARLDYQRALHNFTRDDPKDLRDALSARLLECNEKIFAKDVAAAKQAKQDNNLEDALSFLVGARDVLPENDSRRPDLQALIEEIERALDERSLKAEIETFFAGQGTVDLVTRRRHWEFALYAINPSDTDFDDSKNYTTIQLIELAAKLEEDPEDPERLLDFGMALARTGFTRRAIPPLRKAASLAPGDAEIHYLLGNLYADNSDIEEAVAAFSRAIELAPDIPLTYLFLARTYIAAANDEAAATLLEKAIELASEESGIPEEAKDLLAAIESRKVDLAEPDSLEDRIP